MQPYSRYLLIIIDLPRRPSYLRRHNRQSRQYLPKSRTSRPSNSIARTPLTHWHRITSPTIRDKKCTLVNEDPRPDLLLPYRPGSRLSSILLHIPLPNPIHPNPTHTRPAKYNCVYNSFNLAMRTSTSITRGIWIHWRITWFTNGICMDAE